jgi:hypothetical protein
MAKTEQLNKISDTKLFVQTKDSTFYFFEAEMYQIKNDTLSGIAYALKKDRAAKTTRVNIPWQDIIYVETEKFDIAATAVLAIGSAITIGIIVKLILLTKDIDIFY